jgi:RHS repeat-associated protein
MTMPGRKYNVGIEAYRYGFNGKENDNEVKGEGNQQDYGMRIYDPRLGKFLSVDPITSTYPMLTPYQFASNSPIGGIDKDGLEFFFAGGAGNDKGLTSNGYIANMITAFQTAQISDVVRINAHRDQISDIDFALGAFATTPYNKIPISSEKPSIIDMVKSWLGIRTSPPAGGLLDEKNNGRIQTAFNQAKSQRVEGKQLNLAGYSAGSVVMAQVALMFNDENIRVDNLVLIGSPIDENSELGKTLSENVKAGKIGKILYVASVGDEVVGLASKSADEISKVKVDILKKIISNKAYEASEGKVGSPTELNHLKVAGDAGNQTADKTRANIANAIKEIGVQ